MDLITALKMLDSVRNSDEPKLLYGARKRAAIKKKTYLNDFGAKNRVTWAQKTYDKVLALLSNEQKEFNKTNPHDKLTEIDTIDFFFFCYVYFKLNKENDSINKSSKLSQ